MAPPFIPGNKVTLNDYYHGKNEYLNHVIRTVISVKHSRIAASGWMVTADGPGFQKKSKSVIMDANWFKKVPENYESLSKSKIINRIIAEARHGKSNLEIDRGFQRHVTKADLIGCIRYLVSDGSLIVNGVNNTNNN